MRRSLFLELTPPFDFGKQFVVVFPQATIRNLAAEIGSAAMTNVDPRVLDQQVILVIAGTSAERKQPLHIKSGAIHPNPPTDDGRSA